jgi:hypothetical protein
MILFSTLHRDTSSASQIDPMIGGTIDGEEGLHDDAEPAAFNDTSVAMASNIVRPVGNKKAKRMEEGNNSFARLMLMQQDNNKELTMSN